MGRQSREATFGIIKWAKIRSSQDNENFFGIFVNIVGDEVVFDLPAEESMPTTLSNEPAIFYLESDSSSINKVSILKDQKKPWLKVFNVFLFEIYRKDKNRFNVGVVEKLFSSFEKAVFTAKTPPVNQLFKLGGEEALNEFLGCYLAYSQLLTSQKEGVLRKVFKGSRVISLIGSGVDRRFIPRDVISDELEKITRESLINSPEQALIITKHFGDLVPDDAILEWLAKEHISESYLTDKKREDLLIFIDECFKKVNSDCSYRLNDKIKQSLRDINKNRNAEFIAAHIDFLTFLHNAYHKKSGLLEYVVEKTNLYKRLDCMVIATLLHYFSLGNSQEVVLRVLVSNLWEGICDLGDSFLDEYKILSLFPSCDVMCNYGNDVGERGLHGILTGSLSCEAVYWKEKNLYLCRKKICNHPHSYPSKAVGDNFWNFNAYDWMQHYGYDCNPQGDVRNFLVKFAGYINRLREIVSRMNCRECGSLMAPNLKYSRTEYYEFEAGKVVKKTLLAAYRATVFRCQNACCSSFNSNTYISHCISHHCNSMIDSRDCHSRCDFGRYICLDCGSCCNKHPIRYPSKNPFSQRNPF